MMLNTSGNFSKCAVVVFFSILCMKKLNIATVHTVYLYIFKIWCAV